MDARIEEWMHLYLYLHLQQYSITKVGTPYGKVGK